MAAHDAVESMPIFRGIRIKAVQGLRTHRLRWPAPCPFLQPASCRRPRTPELRRDPPRAPAQRPQPQHRRHIVRLLHRVPPQTLGPRQRLSVRWVIQTSLSDQREGQILISPGGQFVVSPDTAATSSSTTARGRIRSLQGRRPTGPTSTGRRQFRQRHNQGGDPRIARPKAVQTNRATSADYCAP